MLSRFRWLILSLWLVSLTACATPAAPKATSVPVAATSEPPSTLTSVPTTLAAAVTPTSVSTAVTSGAAVGGATVPNSCKALESLVGSYMGGVATTKSLGVPTAPELRIRERRCVHNHRRQYRCGRHSCCLRRVAVIVCERRQDRYDDQRAGGFGLFGLEE